MSRIEELFSKLHKIHVNLMKNLSKQNASEYHDALIEAFQSQSIVNVEPDAKKISEFLLFPLLTSLKKLEILYQQKKVREWSDLNEIMIKSICLIINKIKLNDLRLFYEILNIVSFILSKKMNQSPGETLMASDEFLCACFGLVQSLFEYSSSDHVLNSFYTFKNMTSLGLLISVSLDILCESNSLDVRLEALKTLKSVSMFKTISLDNISMPINRQSINNEQKIAILFASFLPGISIKLIQKFLLTQDLKILNHKIICNLLDLLGHILSSVLNDSLLNEQFADQCFNACMSWSKIDDDVEDSKTIAKLNSLIINRTNNNKDWLKETNDKISILIERLLNALINHTNRNVQISLVKFCYLISIRSYFSLNRNLNKMLKVLVTFAAKSGEEKNEVYVSASKMAIESLKSMESKEIPFKSLEDKYIIEDQFSIISTSMEEILIKMPRLMSSKLESGSEKLGHLNTLYGYLRLIGDYAESAKLKAFFYSNLSNLDQLLQSLITCITFDYKNLNNFYETTQELNELKENRSNDLYNYKGLKSYLDDKMVFEQLNQICEYLGASDAARLLIDQLLTNEIIYLQQEQNKFEIMFLINMIINGLTKKEDKEETFAIIKIVLSNFLSDYKSRTEDKMELAEDLIVEEEANAINSLTVQRNRKIINICLILEAIGISSKCLGQDEFNIFLIDTLYFCLENYLSTNLLIRVVSSKCLQSLATNLQFLSVQSLLSLNYDYLMNDLIVKSFSQTRQIKAKQNANNQPSYVFVLCALMDISNCDLVPYLERLIDDYFMLVELNSHDFDIMIGMCKIIRHMNKSMQRWFPVKFNFIDQESNEEKDLRIRFNLREYSDLKKAQNKFNSSFIDTINKIELNLKDFKKSENFFNDTQSHMDDQNQETEEDQAEKSKKKIPLHVKIQCKCMELYTHLISHPFKQIRMSVIDLIAGSSRNLAEHTDEFLPLVHKLWSPICQRFSFDDFLIKSKIIYILFDLSLFCADFLSSRFRKEFLPRLCSFMTEQAKVSANANKKGVHSIADPTYIYSHPFKLQNAVLTNLAQMAVLFEIKELELEKFIDSSILVYLDRNQPKGLQSLALDAISNCALVDSDIVYVCLHYILPFAMFNSEKEKSLNYSNSIKIKYNFQFNDEILQGLIQLFKNI